MRKKRFLKFITLFVALLLGRYADATIVIDSVGTTASTCSNDGSITVFAKTTTGTLLYLITAGPVKSQVQTTGVFSSLPPGDYTLEISNTANEKFVILATVSGSYQLPDFTPIATPPNCPDKPTGTIDGNPTLSSGLLPYSWELIAPSPVSRPPQTSPVFNNLPQGTYTLRMSDACKNIQTKSVILFTPPNTMVQLGEYVNITSCNNAEANVLLLVSANSSPYKVSYTAGGVSRSFDTTIAVENASIQLVLTGPNVRYGDAFTNITVTNTCGTQVFIPRINICPFVFWESFSTSPGPDCSSAVLTMSSLGDPGNCGNTQPLFPLTVTIKDAGTNSVIETKTYNNQSAGNLGSVAMKPGSSYNITYADNCNHVFTHNITIPVIKRYIDYNNGGQQTLLDSTAITYVYAHGFPSTGTVLSVTGGPASAHSTKKGYAYSEDYIYPKDFFMQPQSDSSLICPIYNTAPGTYYYTVTDTCGNVHRDSFTVARTEVADFYFKYDYIKGCAGESGLKYEFLHNTFSKFTITDLKSQTVVDSQYVANFQNPYTGVLNNLKATDYKMAIEYYGGGIAASLTNILVDRFVASDTIHILPYQNPSLQSSSTVLCDGTLSLILAADSTKGVAPYQYEVISGPQTFPPQPGNLFQLTQKGLYSIRLTDKCGNSTVTAVTVDNLIFPPLIKTGSSCIKGNAALTYGASPYFNYSWTKPDGSIFNGDTLRISPVTPSDTGLYTISRLTTINGCTSTQLTSYRLTEGASDSIDVNICAGQTYTFGNKMLTTSGTYRDTIVTAGCDSISIVHLTVNEYKTDSIAASVCKGQPYQFGNKMLTEAGIYRDTLITSGCDGIKVLILEVSDFKRGQVAASICEGETYTFGSKTITQAGTYSDTLKTATCDSIATLSLSVNSRTVLNARSDKYFVAKGETIQLSVSPSSFSSYIWTSLNTFSNNAVSNPTSIVKKSSIYKVAVTDSNNCIASDTLFIQLTGDTLKSCANTIIYIPAAFTPNNDNRNDYFRIYGLENIAYRDYRITIYSRWGQRIFESSDPLKAWNGNYRETAAEQGNYIYMVRFICEDGKTFTRQGNIVLLR